MGRKAEIFGTTIIMTKAKKYTKTGAALIFAAILGANSSGAGSWKGIQFGGFASQGYIVNSGSNDYFGDSSDGTFDFREYAASASFATGNWRIGAQVFGQDIGEYGNDELLLDWASVDYQPARWLGIRAGRVKTPRGLYNEALDVDALRPFVFMPQSAYDARLRDFNASFDGAMLFGNVQVGDSNTFDYKVYHGDVPMSVESGASAYFNNDVPFPNVAIGMDSATGGSLFWNTWIDGLRLGYSHSIFENFGADRVTDPTINTVLYRDTEEYARHMVSAEYVVGDWTLAVEGGKETALYEIGSELTGPSGFAIDTELVFGYASVIRRLNEKWEFGAYFSHSEETQVAVGFDFPLPVLSQDDLALAIRYDVNYNWLIKAEIHSINGAGKIFTTPEKPQPFESRDRDWNLFSLKTTYTF